MAKTYLPYFTNEEIAPAAARGAVLLLPIGTVESNGPHQLIGCDFIITEKLAEAVAPRAKAVWLPALHYGLSEMHDSLPGTFALDEDLFTTLVETILRAAIRNGFRRIVLLNCHRQNIQPLETLGRKLRREGLGHIALVDPLEVVRDIAGELFADDTAAAKGHGGEPLMSLIAHFNPNDIRLDRAMSAAVSTHMGLKPVGSSRYAFRGSKIGLFPISAEMNPGGAWADVANSNAVRGAEAFIRLCDYMTDFVVAFGDAELAFGPSAYNAPVPATG